MSPPFERADSLPLRLADYLRQQIVAGQMRPGQRLIEQSLAEACQVSRVPLREALRILATEGLVTLSPHRGASVSPTSPEELVDLFEARAALEGAAAAAIAGRRNETSLASMTRIVREMKAAIRMEDRARYYELAAEFHRTLVHASGNAVLVRLYDQIRNQLTRYQAVMSAIPELPKRSIAEHARIIDAIEAGNAAQARANAEHHILGLVQQYKKASAKAPGEGSQWSRAKGRLAG